MEVPGGSEIEHKSNKKRKRQNIPKKIDFKRDLSPSWGPSWAQVEAKLTSKTNTKNDRKNDWKKVTQPLGGLPQNGEGRPTNLSETSPGAGSRNDIMTTHQVLLSERHGGG